MTAEAEVESVIPARASNLSVPRSAADTLERSRRGNPQPPADAYPSTPSLPDWIALPLLTLPALILGAWMILIRRYDGLYGQDPYAYLGYAIGPLRHALLLGTPLTSSYWPLGYPLLAAIASLATGASPAAGQLVNGAAAVLAVMLTYLLARDALRLASVQTGDARVAAIIAALALSVSGYFIQSGVTDMSDSVALAGTLLSAWALMRWLDVAQSGRGAVWLGLSSAALAYAIVTRWGDGILAAVWLLVTLPTLFQCSWRMRLRAAIAGVCPAAVVIGTQLFFAVTVPAGSVHPFAFLGNFSIQGDSWSVLNLFRHSFHNSDGLLRYSAPSLLFYFSEPFRTLFLTPLFAIPVLVGCFEIARRAWSPTLKEAECDSPSRRMGRYCAILMLAGWPAALLLFDSGLPWQDPRWVLAALPPIAMLAGLGCVRVGHRLRGQYRRFFVPALALGILAIAVGSARGLDRVASAQAQEVATIGWVQANVPPRATLLTFEITPGIQFRTRLRAVDLYQLSPVAVDRYVASTAQLYLLVRVDRMATQWAEMDPGKDYRHLAGAGRLRALGSRGGYTLFAVRYGAGRRP